MAIFYPYIKGAAKNGNNLAYTYLDFKTNINPELRLGQTSRGYLVSTNASGTFLANQYFASQTFLAFIANSEETTNFQLLGGKTAENLTLQYWHNQGGGTTTLTELVNFIGNTKTEFTTHLRTTKSLYIGTATWSPSSSDIGCLKVQNNINTATATVTDSCTITNGCNAGFFNATSDYRAKSNIKYLDIDALDLINKVQLYSFNYKDSNEPSIGVIAQDLMDLNIGDFNLVDNKNATGVKGDYMRVKESKLTYILWKAVQELSEQNKKLEARIAQLEQK